MRRDDFLTVARVVHEEREKAKVIDWMGGAHPAEANEIASDDECVAIAGDLIARLAANGLSIYPTRRRRHR
jgi:hypothetical protein